MSETVKIFKKSGLPMEESDLINYREEYRKEFDKILENEKDYHKTAPLLRQMENDLIKKYKNYIEIKIPSTKEEFIQLFQEYGKVEFGLDTNNELVFQINDINLSQESQKEEEF